jgi:hypothetical protein
MLKPQMDQSLVKSTVRYVENVEDLRNEFIFLFGEGVSPEKQNDENCIIARSA